MFDIKETTSEYFLFVPYSQKDRAKGIKGRDWVPGRRCWKYPKALQVRDALIAEFGDQLASVLVSPTRTATAETQRPQLENQNLRNRLSSIQKMLKDISKAAAESNETKILRETAISKNEKLSAFQHALQEKETLLEETQRMLKSVHEELESLKRLPLIRKNKLPYQACERSCKASDR